MNRKHPKRALDYQLSVGRATLSKELCISIALAVPMCCRKSGWEWHDLAHGDVGLA